MSCSNQNIRELLVEYVLDQLSPQDVERVEEHLAACDDCTSDIAFLKTIRKDIVFLTKQESLKHLPASELVQFVEDSGSLEPTKVEEIRRHLLFCRPCQLDHENLASLEAAIESEHKRDQTRSTETKNRLANFVFRPVVGYAIAAGLALFVLFQVSNKPREDAGMPDHFQRIEQQMRSSTSPSTVYRSSSDDHIGLEFRPLSEKLMNAVASINNVEDDERIEATIACDFSDSLNARVSFSSKGIRDGQYRLRIEGKTVGDQELVRATYVFELVTRR